MEQTEQTEQTTPPTEEKPVEPKPTEEEEVKTEEEETKADEKDQPEPITMDSITVPEGLEIPDELGQSFLEIVNNSDLTAQERAQGLIDLQAQAAQAASERVSEQVQEARKQWVEDTKALPDIGGDKLDESLGQIGNLLKLHDTDDGEFRQILDDSGLGDHPAVVKFLHKIAVAHSEGSPVSGKPSGQPRSQADRIYSNS